MSNLDTLRDTKNLTQLAFLLEVKPKNLAFILYRTKPENRYKEFPISKRRGGFRRILAPSKPLKTVQQRLAALLADCLHEIEKAEPARARMSHGFHRGRGTITNALPHRRARFVFNIDLVDFFGTINFGRVRGFFIKNRHFRLKPEVATVIAQIACHENALPQGSPCSPIISNLIAHSLDTHLASLSKNAGVKYTRYADDLTFSTTKPRFPSSIAKQALLRRGAWKPSGRLKQALKNAGFGVNPNKTRMEIRPSRQAVTGLVVNSKLNVSQAYYRETRAMCHRFFRKGSYNIPGKVEDDGKTPVRYTDPARLEGRLAHIYRVRGRLDLPVERRPEDVIKDANGVRELYKKLLNYRYFVGNNRPTIITEGPSDIVYLTEAIRHRLDEFPELGEINDGKLEFGVRFYRSSRINRDILGLGEGYGQLPELIRRYRKFIKAFTRHTAPMPVILIVDNDSGGKKAMTAAAEVSKTNIQFDSTPIWHHITDNLYLLRTPPAVAAPFMSDMEDLFPQVLQDKEVDGKSFDRKKEHLDDSAFGKIVFANQVVKRQAKKTDFDDLVPMLSAIKLIMADLEARSGRT